MKGKWWWQGDKNKTRFTAPWLSMVLKLLEYLLSLKVAQSCFFVFSWIKKKLEKNPLSPNMCFKKIRDVCFTISQLRKTPFHLLFPIMFLLKPLKNCSLLGCPSYLVNGLLNGLFPCIRRLFTSRFNRLVIHQRFPTIVTMEHPIPYSSCPNQ